MLIELKDSFRGKPKGAVIEWPDPMASILIMDGRAVAVKTKPEPQDKAMDAPPVDKMQRKPVGKKRA